VYQIVQWNERKKTEVNESIPLLAAKPVKKGRQRGDKD
jgi:hypothetical protein